MDHGPGDSGTGEHLTVAPRVFSSAHSFTVRFRPDGGVFPPRYRFHPPERGVFWLSG
jgi:hypothetical protein